MRLSEIQAALREESLDGWLFFDHHFRDPIAYQVLDLAIPNAPTRRWYYLIPAAGEPRKLSHRIEPNVLDPLPGANSLYAGWREQTQGLSSLLHGTKRVAMQYSPNCAVPYVAMVDAGTVEFVRSLNVEVATSANLVQLFQAVWTDDMLASHLKAGRLVDEIRREAFRRVSEAVRAVRRIDEYEIYKFIREGFDKASLTTDHGPIVAVNENASNPHYEPDQSTHRQIFPGDLVLIDLWAKLRKPGSVYYDITWTGYCGASPRPDIVATFSIVREARDRAVRFVIDAVAAGRPIRGFEVDDVARGYIVSCGHGRDFFHRTGHSIGTDVHGVGANMDNLETHDERRIIPNTCFSVEPGVYLEGFGVRSEVNVFVGADKAFVTGETQENLLLL